MGLSPGGDVHCEHHLDHLRLAGGHQSRKTTYTGWPGAPDRARFVFYLLLLTCAKCLILVLLSHWILESITVIFSTQKAFFLLF